MKQRAITRGNSRPCRVNAIITVALAMGLGASLMAAAGDEYLDQETLAVPAVGLEAFTRRPLDPDAYYIAVVAGVVPIVRGTDGLFFSAERVEADALYAADGHYNFTERHKCLTFSEPATVVAENRAAHQYTFQLRGTGTLLSLKLDCPRNVPERALTVWVARAEHTLAARLFGCGAPLTRAALRLAEPLPLLVLLVTGLGLLVVALAAMSRKLEAQEREELEARRRAKQERVEREAAAAAEAADAEACREEAARNEAWVAGMIARYEHCPQYADAGFIAACAARLLEDSRRHAAIVAGWNLRAADVLRAQEDLHVDPQRIALLRRRAPEIYERAAGRARLLEAVERLAATMPLKPTVEHQAEPVPLEVKQKPTPEAVREMIVRRVRIAAQDQTTIETIRFEELERARKDLTERGMSDDEVRGVLEGIDAAIREALTRTKGADDGVQKL